MTSDPVRERISAAIDRARPDLLELSHRIHADPELAYAEHHASGWLADALETGGFAVERGAAGMATAVHGRRGDGALHLAICCEYDALPDVGHACGHNIICSAGLGAALAIAPLVDELDLTLSVLGTPAEEGGGGKIGFIDAGTFDDIHAAMMVHPFPGTDTLAAPIVAVDHATVTYRGREAHAAAYPHLGINAGDALVVAQTAMALLRQQLLPTDRIHCIVTNGGEAANIIPAETTADFMVRAPDRERMHEVFELVSRCFEAGAVATGCEVDIDEHTAYDDMRQDEGLGAIYRRNAESIGRTFTDEPTAPYSTDMGNVSYIVPAIHPNIGIDAGDAVNHQAAFAAACINDSADRAVVDGAHALALTIADVAADESVRARLLG